MNKLKINYSMEDRKFKNLWALFHSWNMDKLFTLLIGLIKLICYWAILLIDILRENK